MADIQAACLSRDPVSTRLALKVVNRPNRREERTIVQAVHIYDCARSHRRFRDCRDEDTATAADQKITGARSEAIILDQRPVIRRKPRIALQDLQTMRGLWLRQNEQVHARSVLSSGGFESRRRT